MNLEEWREEYLKHSFSEKDLPAYPIDLFKKWFEEASVDKNKEPNAMVLSTAVDNIPTSRVVLLKEITTDAFIFYTNYESKKGSDIAKNPNVQLLFFWPLSERQVRIHGIASKIDPSKSESYFHSRPLLSKLSASISPQSQIISKEELSQKIEEMKEIDNIPYPKNWGGYQVIPSYYEFWQGQRGRLHDRIIYQLSHNTWKIARLAP
jgi:pyridoxamine 5'-phosphate oxidase